MKFIKEIDTAQATLEDFNAAVDYLRLMDYRLHYSYSKTEEEEFKNIPFYDCGYRTDQGVVPTAEEIDLWYSSLFVFIERSPDFLPATPKNFTYPYRKMDMSEAFPRFLESYILIKFLQAYKKDFIWIDSDRRMKRDDVTTKQLEFFVRDNTFIKALVVDYANVVSFPTYQDERQSSDHYFFESIGTYLDETWIGCFRPFFIIGGCYPTPCTYAGLEYLPVDGVVYRISPPNEFCKRVFPEKVAEVNALIDTSIKAPKKIKEIDMRIQSLQGGLATLEREHSNNQRQIETNNALIAKNQQKIFGKKKALSANEAFHRVNAQFEQRNNAIQIKIKETASAISNLQADRQKITNEIAEADKRIEAIKKSLITDMQDVDVLRFYDPVT